MHEEYPHLLFREHWRISSKARYELGQCDAIVSAIAEMPIRPEHHRQLLRVSLIKGAQATTAIEGNTLSEEEIAQVATGHSLPPSKEYQEIEVRNVIGAMNELLQEVVVHGHAELITPELLLRFHRMIGKDLGEHLEAIPGRFRTAPRIVGPYRSPDHRDVPDLVARMCNWLREQFQYSGGSQTFADGVIEAIIAHVYIEWIHPFGDGNGRTGRLVEFYILLRAGNPDIASHILSNFYNQTRPAYYRHLEMAFKQRDLSGFIDYAVEGFRDGLLATLRAIQDSQFVIAWRSFVHDTFADRKYNKKNVFRRRRQLMLAFPLERQVTFESVRLMDPSIAAVYGQLSDRTLKRDLQVLQEMGLLVATDQGYLANTQALRFEIPMRLRRAAMQTPAVIANDPTT